jgi:hypothetical protein
MKDLSTILATNSNGKDISLGEVNQWLNANNKRELAQFIYDRLYGRYIRPFDYPSDDYRLKYKNGFTIMTNCCLLIETYTSWSEPFFRSTDKKSERCFMYFFKSHDSFKDFATGSRKRPANYTLRGSRTLRLLTGAVGILFSTSRSHSKGLTSLILQVPRKEYNIAARLAPLCDPAKR